MSRYAKKLTKEDLMKGGIVEITDDCKIFGKNGEISIYQKHNQGYMTITIYDLDKDGNKIKVPIKRLFKGCKTVSDTYIYKIRTIGLHRAMWAWFHGEVPEGYVVDHLNNRHTKLEDYHLSNLQLLTPKENLAKERTNWNMYELKCKLNKPRSFFEDKLAAYEAEHEKAKEAGDAELCHKLRSNISQTRARLRYWDAHEEEREDLEEFKKKEAERLEAKRQSVKDRRLLTEWKELFREKGNKTMWRELIRTIKAWDTLNSEQKERVFEILHKTFGNPWSLES